MLHTSSAAKAVFVHNLISVKNSRNPKRFFGQTVIFLTKVSMSLLPILNKGRMDSIDAGESAYSSFQMVFCRPDTTLEPHPSIPGGEKYDPRLYH
jgi:hypothetical protein